MSVSLKANFETLRELAFTDFAAEDGWVRLGLPFAYEPRLVAFKSNMDVDLYISVDLANKGKQIRLPEYGYDTFDITANNAHKEPISFEKGTQVWVKKVAATPTRGHVWLTTMYVEPH